LEATIVIPTYNEYENLPELIRRIRESSSDVTILVVDDSPDTRTANIASELGCGVIRRHGDNQISVYPNTNIDSKGISEQNYRRRSLSSAVIIGIASAMTEKVIVMDADLQHPPEKLPDIINELDNHDFVIASRYIPGGGCVEWDFDRKVMNGILTARLYQDLQII